MLELIGGIWYVEDRIDEDFGNIIAYHEAAALFHGGHYEKAGEALGEMWVVIVALYKPK